MRPTNTRPSEGRLTDMIARHMASPGCVSTPEPRADFVMSGIRAAYSANAQIRKKILADLADVMECRVDDLEFLFTTFETPDVSSSQYELMVPDFHQELMSVAE